MSDYQLTHIAGHLGDIVVHHWPVSQPRFLVLLAHGYGEHLGRYHHVAAHFNQLGAYVFGPDHLGHGQSAGERVLIHDYEPVVDDLHQAALTVTQRYPDLPLVLIGHSMGGMIAARYAQHYAAELQALILSGPLLGEHTQISDLSQLDEIPETPLDISTLSNDPAVGAAYQADPLVWHGPFKRTTLVAMSNMLTDIYHGPSFGNLPTLWLHGESDRLVLPAETKQALDKLQGSHFDFELYQGDQHEIFNEINKEDVLKRASDFALRAIG